MSKRIVFSFTAATFLWCAGISCQKTNKEMPISPSVGQNSPVSVASVQVALQARLSSDELADLDWDHATIDMSANGTNLIVVKSKTKPGIQLMFLTGNPSMYVWQNQAHLIPGTPPR